MLSLLALMADLMSVVLCWRFMLAFGTARGMVILVHSLIPNKNVGMVVGAHVALAGLMIGLIWQGKEPEPKP